MKIGYLGAGAWGYALAHLLASKGYDVISWSIEKDAIAYLQEKSEHPKLKGFPVLPTHTFTTELKDVLYGKDLIIEAVTSAGMRPVFDEIKKLGIPDCPIVLTSKGIEQNTGLLMSDVVAEVLGEEYRDKLGCLSGPTIAADVLKSYPAAIVASAYKPEVMKLIQETFSTPLFRVYTNPDIDGIELGAALKNIIAIACGASDGLGFGENSKAALITRGLHEMRRLAMLRGGKPETLNGLAGLGDLVVTCFSPQSRNYRFGRLIAEGHSVEEAKKKIGMVVEGTYSCVSALQIAAKANIEVPITEAVYKVLYENLGLVEAMKILLQRAIKEENL